LHVPVGSAPLGGTGAQVPVLPGRAQEKQLEVQAVPQHTPWAQKVEAQSVLFEQTAPLGFFPHEPFTQTLVPEHWALVEHELPQRAPLHL
jgi:hypothetical protein